MIYQQTPDFYNEYISHSAIWEGRSRYRNGEDELEHGWAKDAAAKAHKYIDRWRGKNGKWYYKYKQTLTNLKGRYRTRNGGRTNIDLEERENDRGYSSSRSRGDQIYGSRNAKLGLSFTAPVKGSSDRGNSRRYSKQGVNRAISAGRKRAAKKGYKIKGYTGNLTSRGYSGSKGSGESQRQRNLGTRYSSRSYINTTKDTVKIGNTTYQVNKAERAKTYNEYRKNPQRFMAKDAIKNGWELAKSDKHSANKGYKRGKKKKR